MSVRETVMPQDAGTMDVLGGRMWGGVSLTPAQDRAVMSLYLKARQHPLEAELDRWTVLKLAQADGLRMVAMLAEFLSAGEDPAKVLHGLLVDAGFPVAAWAEGETAP